MHLNIQYLRNKVDELNILLDELSPHVIGLSEHGLMSSEINNVKLQGYSLISVFCRSNTKGGGTALYAIEGLSVKEIGWVSVSDLSIEKNL